MLEAVLAHELHHFIGQNANDRRGSEAEVEYDNNHSLVEFYTGLAQQERDIAMRERYLAKAELFAGRYGSAARETLDGYIRRAENRYYQKAA